MREFMPYIPPNNVVAPKKRWNLRKVVYDGGEGGIAIASGEWDFKPVVAIRWNGSSSSPIGNPQSFGHPTWFILPKAQDNAVLISTLIHYRDGDIDSSLLKELLLDEGLVCTSNNCPLLNETPASVFNAKDSPIFLHFMTAGGGRKPPLKKFLDLVRKTHKGMEDIRKVIITDPYILADIGESGKSGGYSNLYEYLSALKLTSNNQFSVFITGAPKHGSDERRRLFDRSLKTKFPAITINNFSSNLCFHDRLYLVVDQKHSMRGVFGPSLNGLKATDIVLMGELEANVIEDMKKLFIK